MAVKKPGLEIEVLMSVPSSHPRYLSLITRDKIAEGIEKGITSIHGLIAHGRGEAFDYSIGEKTQGFAKKAVKVAAAMLLLAKAPVISVNGNTAALAAEEITKLSKLIPAKLEVNIFHASKKRELKIKKYLEKKGAKNVLMPGSAVIKCLGHNRKYCNKKGIFSADVVFVPLEDGDRCEVLRKLGKNVVTIDLNPMSRTAQKANITIVDNIIRALPLLAKEVRLLKRYNKNQLKNIIKEYDNKKILLEAIKLIIKIK